jgi:hypothetical protein
MILAMILAHLVGDFVLQTDKLAAWKARDLGGIAVHGLVVTIVTALFALPFTPFWWQGVLFISAAHILIDVSQLYYKLPVAPVMRFLFDQLLHFLSIFIALYAGGYLDLSTAQSTYSPQLQTILILATGYAFITMPTWVLLKFVGYAVVEGSPPVFPDRFHKYAGILERIIVLTFVLAGFVLLVPLLMLPRMWMERNQLADKEGRPLLLFECLAGIALAIMVGLAIRAYLGVDLGVYSLAVN